MQQIQNTHQEWLHFQQALINWKLIQHHFRTKFKQQIDKLVKYHSPSLHLRQPVFQSKSNQRQLIKEKNKLEIIEQKNQKHKKQSKQLDQKFLQHWKIFMIDWLELSSPTRVHFWKNQKDQISLNKLKRNQDINIHLLYYLKCQPSKIAINYRFDEATARKAIALLE